MMLRTVFADSLEGAVCRIFLVGVTPHQKNKGKKHPWQPVPLTPFHLFNLPVAPLLCVRCLPVVAIVWTIQPIFRKLRLFSHNGDNAKLRFDDKYLLYCIDNNKDLARLRAVLRTLFYVLVFRSMLSDYQNSFLAALFVRSPAARAFDDR